jgi:hypothetical protein
LTQFCSSEQKKDYYYNNVDMNGDGDPVNIYEIVSGPLSAFILGIPSAPLLMPDLTFSLPYYM